MTDNIDNNGRDPRGRFAPDNPGGPGGSRKRALVMCRAAKDAITPEDITALMRKAMSMAREGDVAAMRLVIERTSGRAAVAQTAGPLAIALPRCKTAADCSVALERILDGFSRGTIECESASVLIAAVQARLTAFERTLHKRLDKLERAARQAEHNSGRN